MSKLYQNVYMLDHLTRTPSNDSAVYWSRDTERRHVTIILHWHWLECWWHGPEFYINFSIQEHQIDVLYVSFKSWDSQGSAYTPFHISFTVPLTTIHLNDFCLMKNEWYISCISFESWLVSIVVPLKIDSSIYAVEIMAKNVKIKH